MSSRVSKARKSGEVSELEKILKSHNIRLPPDVLNFWKKKANIAGGGNIVFFDITTPVEGYWVSKESLWRGDYKSLYMEGKKLFVNELKKFLESYLFNNHPDYIVYICPDPKRSVCVIGNILTLKGEIDFEVADLREGRIIFNGSVRILDADISEDGYVKSSRMSIILEPL
jgi:hypothetical protein